MGAILTLTGMLAIGGLGMRHALDADHVATIDGVTFGLLERSSALAPWVGTLFTAGHGLVVTAIAVTVAAASQAVPWLAAPPAAIEWAPLALLALVGLANLKALLSADEYRPVALKGRFVPASLREGRSPLAILAAGVVFALMLDSAAQAAAWGYAAGAEGGPVAAAAAGLAFTLGMMAVATAYGRVMCRVLTRAGSAERAARLRRGIGWGTVALAFGVVGCALAERLGGFEAEAALGALGAAAVAAVAGLALWRGRRAPACPAPADAATPCATLTRRVPASLALTGSRGVTRP